MKHIKTPIAALLAACLLLTGCNAPAESNSPDSTMSTSSSQTQSSSETSSSAPDSSSSDGPHSSVPDESIPSAETPDYSKLTETEQIFKTLKDCLHICDIFDRDDLNLIDINQKISAEDSRGEITTYYKVVNGDIKTEAQFMEKLDSVFTEKRKKRFLEKPEKLFVLKDGDLYIPSLTGSGGYFNKLIINKIDRPDENTVILDLTALAEKEQWGGDEDSTEDFSVTLVKTDNGMRIDECDITDISYFSMEIVYNDISFEIRGGMPTETEQIFKVMKDYGDLYYGMQPGTGTTLEKIADKNTKITVEGRTYPFLKLINAPANTMTELGEKLDGLVTEKLKNEFLDFVKNNDYHYLIKDDDIYVTEECFAYGAPQGADRLYLNSIEYPDEKTVLVNMTSFGDKTKWETEKDIENKFTVKLVRTEDGFKIEECNSASVAYLYYHNEFSYGDISLSF